MSSYQRGNTALAPVYLHLKKSRYETYAIRLNPFQLMLLVLDGSKTFRGSEVTLFKAIAQHLNFEYIIREPKTPGWGSIYNGMAGEMAQGLSDVAWSQMYFTLWKWHFYDITTSYDDSQHCLMVIFLLSLSTERK